MKLTLPTPKRLGRPPKLDWAAVRHYLGTASDADVAAAIRALGHSITGDAVSRQRRKLGIPSHKSKSRQ